MGKKKRREKQILEDHVQGFSNFQRFFFRCLLTTLAKNSKHAWSLIGAKTAEATIQLRSCCDFFAEI